jgi:hypothetical protein
MGKRIIEGINGKKKGAVSIFSFDYPFYRLSIYPVLHTNIQQPSMRGKKDGSTNRQILHRWRWRNATHATIESHHVIDGV